MVAYIQVTPDNVAYLSALVSVSEEVRSRCHVKHVFGDVNVAADSPLVDSFTVDSHLRYFSSTASLAGTVFDAQPCSLLLG